MMNRLAQAGLTGPRRFFEWFHTPARDLFGAGALLIVLLVLVVGIEMIPDLIRYMRMRKM
jgi:uncharacterized protein DUF6893